MADNQKIKDLNNDYKEVLKTVNDIKKAEKELLRAGKELSKQQKEDLKLAEEYLDVLQEQIKAEKESIALEKEQTKILKSHAKLSSEVRKQLGFRNKEGTVFKSLGIELAEIKSNQLKDDVESLDKLQKQEIVVESTLSLMESQAKAVERALKGENGLEEIEQKRRDIQASKLDLTDQQYTDLINAVDRTEELYKKEQRILQLKQTQKDVYDTLPDSIQSSIKTTEGLVKSLLKAGGAVAAISAIAIALGSALSSFTSLDESADKFNDSTGTAISQMGDLQNQAARATKDFSSLGANADDFYDTITATQNEFGQVLKTSENTNRSLLILNKNYGAGNEQLAKTLGLFQNIAGLSEATSANVLLQTSALATDAGVSFKRVVEDIAESAGNSNDFFRGNVEELINQTIQARRLGTTLSQVLKTSESLLDFESSITKELEAASFTGGQFNLTRARALAAAGDELGMQEEILKQIQRSGDFTTKNLFERRAIAEAVGMETSEIDRLIGQQNRLNSLSSIQKDNAKALLQAGVDISNIKDDELAKEAALAAQRKEQQGQLANIKNAFSAITTSLGSAFLPLLETASSLAEKILRPFDFLGKVLTTINDNLLLSVPLYGAILASVSKRFIIEKAQLVLSARRNILAGIDLVKAEMAAGASLRRAIADVFSVSMGSFRGIPFGAIAGAALAAGTIATLMSSFSKAKQVGDLMINPNGGPIVSSPTEGGLFQGTRNDALIMAPRENLMGSQNTGDSDELIRTIKDLKSAYMKGAQVNLDGQRVMRGLGRVGNETTQNNFSLV